MILENYFNHNTTPDYEPEEVPVDAEVEDNTEVDADDNYYDGATYQSSEDIDEEEFEETVTYEDKFDFLTEGTNIDSLKTWFSDEQKQALHTCKMGNKLFKNKKYEEAKKYYKEAQTEFDKLRNKVKTLDKSVVSTLLSWIVVGGYIYPFITLIQSCQILLVEKDWWKPTTMIKEFITELKNFIKSEDFNIVRVETMTMFEWLVNYCKRRQIDCDNKIKEAKINKMIDESYIFDEATDITFEDEE